jgi:hypothetical protein
LRPLLKILVPGFVLVEMKEDEHSDARYREIESFSEKKKRLERELKPAHFLNARFIKQSYTLFAEYKMGNLEDILKGEEVEGKKKKE